MKEPHLDISRSIVAVFQPLSRLFLTEFKAGSSGKALTFAQLRLIRLITHGINQVGKLAVHLGMSQPALSKMVNVLVRKGLVKRVPRASDRRQIELRITPKGAAAIQAPERRVCRSVEKRMASLSMDERQIISAGVAKLTLVIQQEQE